jgi:hypothetical protein
MECPIRKPLILRSTPWVAVALMVMELIQILRVDHVTGQEFALNRFDS